MKKLKIWSMMMLVVLALTTMVACGGDEEDSNSSKELDMAYQKLKASIVGTWVDDSYYSNNREGNPYIKYGWNDYLFNKDEIAYIFSENGEVTFKNGNKSTYSIYKDENKTPYYTEKTKALCWPYSKGVIYLKIETDYSPYYAEIKEDGMLYLYNTVTEAGGDGVPKYRYKKE